MNTKKLDLSSLHNINVSTINPLITPEELKSEFPLTPNLVNSIIAHRQAIGNIIAKKDSRLLVVVGPCSIHDPKSAWEYAQKLDKLQKKLSDKLFIVMRVYFEKPRTTVGWKGLINDPNLDGSCNMNLGLNIARKLLLQIAELGLPIATEMLDPVVPQYISDLISWSAIGARTTESQTHREMTSGLSMPVGFKNATSGNLQVALDAINAAKNPHSFIGINQDGRTSLVRTKGNKECHVVLRGGSGKPNFDRESIEKCVDIHKKSDLDPALMIDCSHANSNKLPERQEIVLKDVIEQRKKAISILLVL